MKRRRLVLFIVIAISMGGLVFALTQGSEDRSKLLSQLQSDEWKERAAALEKLLANPSNRGDRDVNAALIELLDRENQLVDETLRASDGVEGVSVKYGEGYAEYYSILSAAVDKAADLADKRTLAVLINSSYNPESPFALKIAGLGETVIPLLLDRANSDIAPHRGSALAVLGEVMKRDKDSGRSLPASVRQQIAQVLMRGAVDADVGVRVLAVRSLGIAGDKEALQLLHRVAEGDPAAVPGRVAGTVRYPVRDEALKAMNLIDSEQKLNRR